MNAPQTLDDQIATLEARKAKLETLHRLQCEVARLEGREQHASALTTITRIVAEHFHLPIARLLGHERPQWLCDARFLIWRIARELTGITCQELGYQFGDRHHATIVNGLKTLRNRLQTDAELRRQFAALETQCREAMKTGLTDANQGNKVPASLTSVQTP
jgi:chromosomal replication initiation ATPase DnaA